MSLFCTTWMITSNGSLVISCLLVSRHYNLDPCILRHDISSTQIIKDLLSDPTSTQNKQKQKRLITMTVKAKRYLNTHNQDHNNLLKLFTHTFIHIPVEVLTYIHSTNKFILQQTIVIFIPLCSWQGSCPVLKIGKHLPNRLDTSIKWQNGTNYHVKIGEIGVQSDIIHQS